MIAVICAFDKSIKLLPDNTENRELLKAHVAEIGKKEYPASDKLDAILKALPDKDEPRGTIVNCSAVFLFQSEW